LLRCSLRLAVLRETAISMAVCIIPNLVGMFNDIQTFFKKKRFINGIL
jgi:hypothetical protein